MLQQLRGWFLSRGGGGGGGGSNSAIGGGVAFAVVFGRPLCQLMLFLVLIPFFVTYLHFYVTVSAAEHRLLLQEQQQFGGVVGDGTSAGNFNPQFVRVAVPNSVPPAAIVGGAYRLQSSINPPLRYRHLSSYYLAAATKSRKLLLLRFQPDAVDVAAFLSSPTTVPSSSSARQPQQQSSPQVELRLHQDASGYWCFYVKSAAATEVLACNYGQQFSVLGNYYYRRRRDDDKDSSRSSDKSSNDDAMMAVVATVSPLATFGSTAGASSSSRNPDKLQSSSSSSSVYRRFEPVVERPATMLLIGAQVLLALAYFQYRVDPSCVAKIYSVLVGGGSGGGFEIWRCFSAATAHFEVWHLLFNMMSLEGLGRELESRYYDSISFLMYNLSLMPLTTAIWLVLHYLERRWRQSRQHQQQREVEDRPTVGFSGVLFAWMVVAALEQPATCPVFFLPDLCFSTHSLFGGAVKFSLAPFVQLAVAQVILPRVSLSGHLAGMICGFFLHWGFLSLRWFQPAISVPLLYLLYLRIFRYSSFSTTGRTDISLVLVSSPLPHAEEGVVRRMQLQRWILRMHVAALGLSAFVVGALHSSTISFGLTAIFFLCLALSQMQFHNPNDSPSFNGNGSSLSDDRSRTFSRAYIVVASIVQVSNSMTLASWAFVSSSTTAALSVWISQCMSLLGGICLSCSFLGTGGNDESGIFKYSLCYTVVRPGSVAGGWLVGTDNSAGGASLELGGSRLGSAPSSWAPFRGTGRTLGTRRRDADDQGIGANSEELSELL